MFLHNKYYLEIKNRFFLVLLSWSFTLIICSVYKEVLLSLIIKLTSSTTKFCESNIQLYFIFTDVKELFYVYLKLIFFVTNHFCVVLLLYQIFMFFYLGLYVKEYKKLKNALKFGVVFFIITILMSYVFVIPLSWNFFLSFQFKANHNQLLSSLFFEAKISEFFDFVTQTYIVCLLSFQFLGLALLSINSLFSKIKHKKLKIFRKLCYFSFFLFSTVVTPPDVISQIIMSFFLVLIYEVFIFVKIYHLLFNK